MKYEMYERCENCILKQYCITQRHSYESCDDMVQRYNAGLLIPPELCQTIFI